MTTPRMRRRRKMRRPKLMYAIILFQLAIWFWREEEGERKEGEERERGGQN